MPFQAEPSDTPPADPDYFPIQVGDTWDIIKGVNGGTITGTFDSVSVVDTLLDLTPTQTFQVLYTSPTLVQLRLDRFGTRLRAVQYGAGTRTRGSWRSWLWRPAAKFLRK